MIAKMTAIHTMSNNEELKQKFLKVIELKTLVTNIFAHFSAISFNELLLQIKYLCVSTGYVLEHLNILM